MAPGAPTPLVEEEQQDMAAVLPEHASWPIEIQDLEYRLLSSQQRTPIVFALDLDSRVLLGAFFACQQWLAQTSLPCLAAI